MEAQLSPNYSHEKLVNASIDDLIDVFEDIWLNYILAPAALLLQAPHGDVAAMIILSSYFEAMAGIVAGEDTSGKSKKFFVAGFTDVFRSDSAGIEAAAAEIYKHIRCGLAHEGMLSHKVNYSRSGSRAFFLTYPKRGDGSLNMDGGAAGIIVNPQRMYDGIVHHFSELLNSLRDKTNVDLRAAFQKSFERQIALGKESNVVGMTEADFLGRS